MLSLSTTLCERIRKLLSNWRYQMPHHIYIRPYNSLYTRKLLMAYFFIYQKYDVYIYPSLSLKTLLQGNGIYDITFCYDILDFRKANYLSPRILVCEFYHFMCHQTSSNKFKYTECTPGTQIVCENRTSIFMKVALESWFLNSLRTSDAYMRQ